MKNVAPWQDEPELSHGLESGQPASCGMPIGMSGKAVRRNRKAETGQVLPMAALMMLGMLGMCAMVIDMGRIYIAYDELQASTDAAALAGALSMPANTTAVTQATTYSGVTGNLNAQANLTGVTFMTGYPKILCLTTLTSQGIPCQGTPSGNAIQVKETVTLPLYFAGLFGHGSQVLTATSTAAMRGATPIPYNVAIVLDTTASMQTSDSNCGGLSRINCALQGVQTMLPGLDPCAASYSTCSFTNGNATNSVDRVSLFVFPNVTIGTAANDYNCSGSSPTIPVYSLPPTGATTYAPTGSTTATYQAIPWQSDYRTSDTAVGLNISSDVVKAVNGKTGCTGIQAPGGDGTYYAGVIYAAQASLAAEQLANPGSKNVMIVLSDGDASASSSKIASSTTDGKLTLNGTGSNNVYTYPSALGQCGQAVVAANAATAAGTTVYTVAYGSGSSGCSTDATYSAYPGITPCQTMEKMASSAATFFSDYNQSGSGSTCQSASQPTTSINQIFQQIVSQFTSPRLIPNGLS